MNTKSGKKSPSLKLLFVILYIVSISLFDTYCYGIIYQQKIQKENYKNPFWSWVFWESGHETGGEHVIVIRYRVIQKSLEITGIIIIFYFCGIWPAIGLVLSHYHLTYDLFFYIILNQTNSFENLEKALNPYWLQNWYQIGYFILKPFNTLNFYVSGIGGLLIPLIFCFLPFERKNIAA